MRNLFTPVLPILVFLTALVLTSCRLDEGPITISQVGDIPVEFQFEVGMLKALTKSEQRSLYEFEEGFEESYAASSDSVLSKALIDKESKVSNLWVLQFNNDPAGDRASTLAIPPTYLHSVSSSGKIEPLLVKGTNQTIYVIANTCNSKLFSECKKNEYNIEAFKQEKITYKSAISKNLVPMIGSVVGTIHSDGSILANGQEDGVAANQILLKRLLSRITMKYIVSDNYRNTVSATQKEDLKVLRMCLVNVLDSTSIFPAVTHLKEVREYYKGLDTLYAYDSDQPGSTIPPYDNTTGATPGFTFYMSENQGGKYADPGLTGTDVNDSKFKTAPPVHPTDGSKSTASYIEIVCAHTPYSGGYNEITYRTYVGHAPIEYYNIAHNYNYTFTITLGGTTESGRVTQMLPTVSTVSSEHVAVTLKGAELGGTITSYGTNGNIEHHGIAVGLSPIVKVEEDGITVTGGGTPYDGVVPNPWPSSPHTFKVGINNANGDPIFKSNSKYYYRAFAKNENKGYAHGKLDSLVTNVIVHVEDSTISIVESTNAQLSRYPGVHFHGSYEEGGNSRKPTDLTAMGFTWSTTPKFDHGTTGSSAAIFTRQVGVAGSSTYRFASKEAVQNVSSTDGTAGDFYVTSYVIDADNDTHHSQDTTKLHMFAVLTNDVLAEQITYESAILGGLGFGRLPNHQNKERGIRYRILYSDGTIVWKDQYVDADNQEIIKEHVFRCYPLEANSNYLFEAYRKAKNTTTNKDTIVYGPSKTFTTPLDLKTVPSGTLYANKGVVSGVYSKGTITLDIAKWGVLYALNTVLDDQMVYPANGFTEASRVKNKEGGAIGGSDIQSFSATIGDDNTLYPGDTRKVRAYIQLQSGVATKEFIYGDPKTLFMVDPKGIENRYPTLIDTTKATLGGYAAENLSATWHEAGFIYWLSDDQSSLALSPSVSDARHVDNKGKIRLIAKSGVQVGDYTEVIENLLPNTKYQFRPYIIRQAGSAVTHGAILEFSTDPWIAPLEYIISEMNNDDITTVKLTSLIQKGGGEHTYVPGTVATKIGNAVITEFGVLLQRKSELDKRDRDPLTGHLLPMIWLGKYDDRISNLTIAGDIDGQIRKLDAFLSDAGTVYIARSYAMKSKQVGQDIATVVYGDEVTITTWDRPAVTTFPVDQTTISNTTAALTGEITGLGEVSTPVTLNGIEWRRALGVDHKVLLDYAKAASVNVPVSPTVPYGITQDLTGLLSNTKYAYRAYAAKERDGINHYGVGIEEYFTTDPVIYAPVASMINEKGGTFTVEFVRGGCAQLNGIGLKFIPTSALDVVQGSVVDGIEVLSKEPSIYTEGWTLEGNKTVTTEVKDKLVRGTYYTVYPYAYTINGHREYGTSLQMRTFQLPTITPALPTDSTATGASFIGNIVAGKHDDSSYEKKGIVYQKVETPALIKWDSLSVDWGTPPVAHTFDIILKGTESPNILTSRTDYFYKMFVKLSHEGVVSSARGTFTTLAEPGVTVSRFSGVKSVTFTASLPIGGGAAIEERGILVGENITPTVANNAVMLINESNSTEIFATVATTVDGLNFTLEWGTDYYARAYVINAGGTISYGQVSDKFTTLDCPTMDPVSASVTITGNSVVLKGQVLSDGGDKVTEYGFAYSYSDPNPTYAKMNDGSGIVLPSSRLLSSGVSMSNFPISTPSFNLLANSTTIYVRPYAKNAVGVGEGRVMKGEVKYVDQNSGVSGGPIWVPETGVWWAPISVGQTAPNSNNITWPTYVEAERYCVYPWRLPTIAEFRLLSGTFSGVELAYPQIDYPNSGGSVLFGSSLQIRGSAIQFEGVGALVWQLPFDGVHAPYWVTGNGWTQLDSRVGQATLTELPYVDETSRPTTTRLLRCVLGDEVISLPAPNVYTDEVSGINAPAVWIPETNVWWAPFSVGQTAPNSNNITWPTYVEAERYCVYPWRLPTIAEFRLLSGTFSGVELAYPQIDYPNSGGSVLFGSSLQIRGSAIQFEGVGALVWQLPFDGVHAPYWVTGNGWTLLDSRVGQATLTELPYVDETSKPTTTRLLRCVCSADL